MTTNDGRKTPQDRRNRLSSRALVMANKTPEEKAIAKAAKELRDQRIKDGILTFDGGPTPCTLIDAIYNSLFSDKDGDTRASYPRAGRIGKAVWKNLAGVILVELITLVTLLPEWYAKKNRDGEMVISEIKYPGYLAEMRTERTQGWLSRNEPARQTMSNDPLALRPTD